MQARRNAFLGVAAWIAALAGVHCTPADARPHVPDNDAVQLGTLPAGTHHSDLVARRMAGQRIDMALPLAQFYIGQARSSGDLRYLGYAEAVLAPWSGDASTTPAALVLKATIQQSRHDFDGALATLDRALTMRRDDAQAWLTRATILRVTGRNDEALQACGEFTRLTDQAIGGICRQGVLGLHGQLAAAYGSLEMAATLDMTPAVRAWRASELGEMAVRLGNGREAERWFRDVLAITPGDFYVQAAYADLLLQQGRNADVLALLKGQDSIEPLLLRIAIAQRLLEDPGFPQSRLRLAAAFDAETRRGEPVHRREQARYLLEVESRPGEALDVAQLNWQVQREPDDLLVLLAAARAAGQPLRAGEALAFARAQGLQDGRLARAETGGT